MDKNYEEMMENYIDRYCVQDAILEKVINITPMVLINLLIGVTYERS